jgi:hypothetical protein
MEIYSYFIFFNFFFLGLWGSMLFIALRSENNIWEKSATHMLDVAMFYLLIYLVIGARSGNLT